MTETTTPGISARFVQYTLAQSVDDIVEALLRHFTIYDDLVSEVMPIIAADPVRAEEMNDALADAAWALAIHEMGEDALSLPGDDRYCLYAYFAAPSAQQLAFAVGWVVAARNRMLREIDEEHECERAGFFAAIVAIFRKVRRQNAKRAADAVLS